MANKYRLVVSDQVTFTARLTLLDGDKERVFGMRLQARRLPDGMTLEAALKATPFFSDFLTARGLALLAWDGDPPLQDEQGSPAPADAEALQALLAQQGIARGLLDVYVEATGGKARLGN